MVTRVVDIIDLDDSDEDDDVLAVTDTVITDETATLIGVGKICTVPLVPLECMPFWKEIKNGCIPIQCIKRSSQRQLRKRHLHSNQEHSFEFCKAFDEFQPKRKKIWFNPEQLNEFCKPVSVVVERMPLRLLKRYLKTSGGILLDKQQNGNCPATSNQQQSNCLPSNQKLLSSSACF
ncbi:hypothetical protein ACJJTC_003215 [Scirpophaga incertulas]